MRAACCARALGVTCASWGSGGARGRPRAGLLTPTPSPTNGGCLHAPGRVACHEGLRVSMQGCTQPPLPSSPRAAEGGGRRRACSRVPHPGSGFRAAGRGRAGSVAGRGNDCRTLPFQKEVCSCGKLHAVRSPLPLCFCPQSCSLPPRTAGLASVASPRAACVGGAGGGGRALHAERRPCSWRPLHFLCTACARHVRAVCAQAGDAPPQGAHKRRGKQGGLQERPSRWKGVGRQQSFTRSGGGHAGGGGRHLLRHAALSTCSQLAAGRPLARLGPPTLGLG